MFNSISYITNLPLIVKILLLLFCDSLLLAFSSWLSFSIRLEDFNWFINNQYNDLFLFIFLNIIICIPNLYFLGLYKSVTRFFNLTSTIQVVQAVTITVILNYLLFNFIEPTNFPRSYFLILFFITIIFISFPRLLVGYYYNILIIYNQSKKTNNNIKNILIYGTNEQSKNLATTILNNSNHNLIGFIDNENIFYKREILRRKIYPIKDLQKCITEKLITDIFFISDHSLKKEKYILINLINGLNTRVVNIPNIEDFINDQYNQNNIESIDIDDLLGRERILPDLNLIEKNIKEKKVLVTGAAGSIGNEICKIVIKFKPQQLYLLDISETNLFYTEDFLKKIIQSHNLKIKIIPLLVSITDNKRIDYIFETFKPDTVYHAAAYKHVNLVEKNIYSALYNNFIGTINLVASSIKFKTKNFVFVSTDKAVNPINVMGASKRLCEIFIQSISKLNHINLNFIDDDNKDLENHTLFTIVRFGNVLGSSGSVVPIFKDQIIKGGPVTLTDKKVTRYFMNIKEAAELVIQAGALTEKENSGQICYLDMGEPIEIYKLAEMMIKYSGYTIKNSSNPIGDIEIKIIGLKDGEKLHEELVSFESSIKTKNKKIYIIDEERVFWPTLKSEIKNIKYLENDVKIYEIFEKLIKNFNDESNKNQFLN